MGLFQPTHFLIVLVVLVMLFGGRKIPELMRGVGRGAGELQKGLQESQAAMQNKAAGTSDE